MAGAAQRGRPWSPGRILAWCAGVAVAAAGLLGPVADASHHDVAAHMATHLLMGMLAPLLLVTARPFTLVLRALPTGPARHLSWLLRSVPVRVLSHPITALVLNAGGLWLLYTTGLYSMANRHDAVHLAVHLHVLLSGWLLTAALVGTDPAPHRPGFPR